MDGSDSDLNNAWNGQTSALFFYCPFAFLAAEILAIGFVRQAPWAAWAVPIATAVLMALLDPWSGAARRETTAGASFAARLAPWLYVMLRLLVNATVTGSIAAGTLSPLQATGLVICAGIGTGSFGMVAAHELVHAAHPFQRWLGIAFLVSVGYPHFAVAHVEGHHRKAATPHDPATAWLGESLYQFLIRTIPGQAVDAWQIETVRLRRRGHGWFHVSNRVLQGIALELALFGAVLLRAGIVAMGCLLAIAVIAVLMLEAFNYVAHYGLQRRATRHGFERLEPRHSWNAAGRFGNWSLFNMGRHSDHHRRAGAPYEHLIALEGGSLLPGGYAAAMLLALLPPLWFHFMDRRARLACPDRGPAFAP